MPPMGFQTWLLESPAIDVSRVPAGCYIVKVERVRDTDAPVHRVGWGGGLPYLISTREQLQVQTDSLQVDRRCISGPCRG